MTNDILDALAKPPPPPSELDELMDRDPLQMTRDDVDAIIAYHRNLRAKREETPKGRRRTDLVEHDNAKPIDLAALGLLKPKPTLPTQSDPSPKPAGGASFRRL